MESLALKLREPVTDEVECWDDGDLQGLEDLQLRNVSSTTTATHGSARNPHSRDSMSSRTSAKSDLDDESEWQLHLPVDDDVSTSNAIADAKSRGIPIPANVPTSALLGGTIKRLGGKRIKKVLGDDWGEDLEIPKAEGLRLKTADGTTFPESLRQLSTNLNTSPGPVNPQAGPSFMERLQASGKVRNALSTLEKFRDDDDADFGDVPTIKVAKNRSPMKQPAWIPQIDRSVFKEEEESLEDGLEFPADGDLRLSARKDIPKTPAAQTMDEEPDWADGSQGSYGTSHGGARRTGRSNRSSSVSARSPSVFSPSLSSCLTAESEDEGLDGLVLPDAPINFEEALKKRLESASPEAVKEEKPAAARDSAQEAPPKEDFFSEIELGDGDVFDSGKLTLNRNIKHKATRQISPKRSSVTLTFTNKPVVPSRIPKATGQDRQRSKLEPVMESSGPVHVLRRATSRIGGHSNQSSVTSLPTPTSTTFVPSAAGPATPSRRGLTTRTSRDVIGQQPTTTSAQLLKAKRSMPLLPSHSRSPISPPRTQPTFHRPPSRTDRNSRSGALLRPKTPIDRSESSLANARRPPVPFLPAGNATASSHHVNNKASRTSHRPSSSDSTNENVPLANRPGSRLSNSHHRPYTPTTRNNVAPESLARAAASKRQLTKPLRRRAYGDGNELDAFDDLPTSSAVESKFQKPTNSVGKPPSNSGLRKIYQQQNLSSTSVARTESGLRNLQLSNHSTSSLTRPESGGLRALQHSNLSASSIARTETPNLRTPLSPSKIDANLPRFAQSTTASLARKQRTGATSPQALRHPPNADNNTVSLSATWKVNAVKQSLGSPSPRHNLKRSAQKIQQKPHLIKQLGTNAHETKNVKGMSYNPALFRWEGNEHILAPFDVPPQSPNNLVATPSSKPALIANVGSTKGVQVVGGMVFDPQRMCWLKMAPHQPHSNNHRGHSSSGAISLATEEDEEDPFAGLEDLPVDDSATKPGAGGSGALAGRGGSGDAGSDDDWVVGEEFDVGPEFVRRQRNEEEKWKRRMGGWTKVLAENVPLEVERWAIRELVLGGGGGR